MTPGTASWRQQRLSELLHVARRATTATGFGWLLDDGSIDSSRPEELWINARMTYVWSLAGDAELAAHGISALREPFADHEHGGWFDTAHGVGGTDKNCYGHDFVLLAAATGTAHSVAGARALLDAAVDVHLHRFWDSVAGRCVESWNRDWTHLDSYRGANSNMHAVEAYLAVARVTGDAAWLQRALSICQHLIGVTAREHVWRVVEHFDADWTGRPKLNRDRPGDPFKPFGATPGHALEWARLLVELRSALGESLDWLLGAAEALFDRAVTDALSDDPLLPYTTDWDGVPVVNERFHWVMAEAVSAAETLAAATGRARYRDLADRWWAEIDQHVIADDGSWRHELAPDLTPSSRTWQGRPDTYHAVNALTLPDRLAGLTG